MNQQKMDFMSFMTLRTTSKATRSSTGIRTAWPAMMVSDIAHAAICPSANPMMGMITKAGMNSSATSLVLCLHHSLTCPSGEIQNSILRIEYRMDSALRSTAHMSLNMGSTAGGLSFCGCHERFIQRQTLVTRLMIIRFSPGSRAEGATSQQHRNAPDTEGGAGSS